jgi:cAMP phosphodiesterase
MKINVIGCHGGLTPGLETTSFSINDRFFVDAGSICSRLPLVRQTLITDIFLTHGHLDHIKDICFLLENTFAHDREPITVRSSTGTIENLRKHIFNDQIWPNFEKIFVKDERPFLQFAAVDQDLEIGGVKIKTFRVNHPSNGIGFLLDDGDAQVIFTGDTGPTPQIWKVANECKKLRAIFTEVSFPSRMQALATASGHHTFSSLLKDLKNLKKTDTPIYISHLKPLFLKELFAEFNSLRDTKLKILHSDDEFLFV